ncbi:unnamed protein product [Mytilus coruscus]|uniref:Uncharacterized protein n=1 Tax=Mytilus coruscus TaxID=42192 RepID=A0A6J8DQX2_MYTCO|nr:unnamed protein product [Mytilus coruscus]
MPEISTQQNINKISKDLPKVLDATLCCYDGDCTSENSIVCKGDAALNLSSRSSYLSTYQITALQMDKIDKCLPQEILKMKLKGPLASGVHRNNNMPEIPTQLKCTNLGVDLSEQNQLYLEKIDNDFKYNQDYILRPAVQERRMQESWLSTRHGEK